MTFIGRFLKLRVRDNPRTLGDRRRSGRTLLVGTCLFLLGLTVGIYLFFPTEALQQRIIQEIKARTGTDVQIEQVSLYPPLSLCARLFNVVTTVLPVPLKIDQLRVSPKWSTLLSSDPGVQFQAQLMNGDATAEILKSGVINATATGLRFELPLQKPMIMTISGNLGQATVNAATRLAPETKTQLSLQLSDVRISHLDFFKEDSPGVALGAIFIEGKGQGRAMKINALSVTGGDFNINGEGTLLIGRTSATSRMNLSLNIKPAGSALPALVSLLELTAPPDANGDHRLRLTGTLAAPTIAAVQ